MTQRETSGWAIGWTAYAGIMMIMLGFFHGMAGLVGVLEDELYVAHPELPVRARRNILALDSPHLGSDRCARRVRAIPWIGLGSDRRSHLRFAERIGQLRLAPLVPALVNHHDHRQRVRDLVADRPQSRHPATGLMWV